MLLDISEEYCVKIGDPKYPEYIKDCSELSDSIKVRVNKPCEDELVPWYNLFFVLEFLGFAILFVIILMHLTAPFA